MHVKNDQKKITNGTISYCKFCGNAGMATAGSGDVLAGIIGALLGQSRLLGLTPLEAAALGAYIHGRAGDAFAHANSQQTLTASGLTASLSAVFPNNNA
ncbi:MAG: NAD(P)H-hydrate dehydratase [Candidatus Kapaibacteriota bacterium]